MSTIQSATDVVLGTFEGVKVIVPKDLAPLVVPPVKSRAERGLRSRHHRHVKPQPAVGCIFTPVVPASVASGGAGVTICKYAVPGDANATDTVFYQGGDRVTSISLVLVFYGSAWLTSSPSASAVVQGIQSILSSPYLSQLGQYGVTSLTLKQSIIVTNPTPGTQHLSNDVADIVWDLFDQEIFPESDEPGGNNIYMVFYPPGTNVSDLVSCAWHSQYSGSEIDLDWTLIGGVDFPSGPDSTTILRNIVRAFSHELVETLTDPDATAGFLLDRSLNGGREIGDACNNSVDFLNGMLVNAYWSESHKACIIPKPLGYVTVSDASQPGPKVALSSGTAHVDALPCLEGDYRWSTFFQQSTITFTASAHHFQNPTFAWLLLDGSGGVVTINDGFSGLVTLECDTWSEDVNGSSLNSQVFAVQVSAAADVLTIVNDDQNNAFNFQMNIDAIAREGAFTAARKWSAAVTSEVFQFEDAYYQQLQACEGLLERLVATTVGIVRRRDPGAPPPYVWVDNLSPWVSGKRLALAAQAAAAAAAAQRADATLASKLRRVAALVTRVPSQALTPRALERGGLSGGTDATSSALTRRT